MKKRTNPSTAKDKPLKSIPSPIVPDDRLGPDEPVDQANEARDEPSGVTAGEDEAQAQGHRVSKIEPNDEHNNEDLVEEGMQGYMHSSLTKPRKLK